ncbi:MAG: 50S ribosomal protein L9 [Candidatus Omnitrophica bacterium]|nr:50S ribosomal protein L9 [Candidatus Omnitrophota bacterium]
MEVILTQNVEGVGKQGEKLKVKDGYARNFLFPKNLAVAVTPANMKRIEQEKERRDHESEKRKTQAEALRDKLAALSLTIAVLVQEKEKLYGSIGAAEICKALKDEGHEIDEQAIALEEPIKALGIYQVPLKLHPEVEGQLKVWIVKK